MARSLGGLAVLALLAGCGPALYVDGVTQTASRRVESARAAGAEKRAPYWFTLAVEYLDKAREDAAQADFQSANRFGRRATAAADRAIAATREK
jgi:hypothetical protein